MPLGREKCSCMFTLKRQEGPLQGSDYGGGQSVHTVIKAHQDSRPRAASNVHVLIIHFSQARLVLPFHKAAEKAPHSMTLPCCRTPWLESARGSARDRQMPAICLLTAAPSLACSPFGAVLWGVLGRFSSCLFILGVNWILETHFQGMKEVCENKIWLQHIRKLVQ